MHRIINKAMLGPENATSLKAAFFGIVEHGKSIENAAEGLGLRLENAADGFGSSFVVASRQFGDRVFVAVVVAAVIFSVALVVSASILSAVGRSKTQTRMIKLVPFLCDVVHLVLRLSNAFVERTLCQRHCRAHFVPWMRLLTTVRGTDGHEECHCFLCTQTLSFS